MNNHKRNNKYRAEQNVRAKKTAAAQQQNNDIIDKTKKDDPGGNGGKPPAMAEVINCDKKISSKVQKQTVLNQNIQHQQQQLQQQPPINNKINNHHNQHVNSNNSTHINSDSVKHTTTISNVSSSNSTDLKYLHKKFKRLASATTIVETNSSSLLVSNKEPTTKLPIQNSINNSATRAGEATNNQSQLSPATTISFTVANSPPVTTNTLSQQQQQQFLNSVLCANESESSSSSFGSGLLVSGQPQSDQNDQPNRRIFNQFTSFNSSDINSGSKASTHNGPIVSLVSRDNRLDALTDYDFLVAANQESVALSLGRPIVYATASGAINSSGSPSPLHYAASGQSLQQSSLDDQVLGGGAQNRYVCPYCQLNCAKPSVLQKHIRAHTNERPYPCLPCGFAFKTRSNLYKHRRSRAHIQKIQGEEHRQDEDSFGSDVDTERELISSAIDLISSRASPVDRMSSPSSQPMDKPYKPKFHNAALYSAKVEPKIAQLSCITPTGGHPLTPGSMGSQSKNPFSYNTLTSSSITSSTSTLANHPLMGQNVETLEQHISKIISENEAIIEVVEPALQKKYHRITGINRQTSCDNNTAKQQQMALQKHKEEMQMLAISQQQQMVAANVAPQPSVSHSINNLVKSQQQNVMLVQQNFSQPLVINTSAPPIATPAASAQQPLNLSKPSELLTTVTAANPADNRKRSHSETGMNVDNSNVADHPQNPERSIIKDLLLNSRGFGVVDGEAGNSGEQPHKCPSCNISFRGADILKYHTICYCQGNSNSLANSPQSAPISPVASPSHHFYRSGSVHGRYNPNSLKQIASSSLKTGKSPSTLRKLARSQLKLPRPKPENIVIATNSGNSTSGTSSNPPLVLAAPQTMTYVNFTSTVLPVAATGLLYVNSAIAAAHNPLPSPGPLLGKTRLVDTYVTAHNENTLMKREINEDQQQVYQQGSMMLVPPPSPHTLKMFGGEVKIMNKNSGGTGNPDEMKIARFDSGGSIISLSPHAPDEPSPRFRANNLYSGGTALQIEYPVSSLAATANKQPMTPKLIVTITPTLTPTITTNSLFMSRSDQPHQMTATHFQFPPINSITAFNPLTLPPPAAMSPGQASTIMHGGKLIPFVEGIPGPNSLINKQQDQRKLPSTSPHHYPTQHHRKAAPSPLNLPPPPNDTSFNVAVQPQSPYLPSVSPQQQQQQHHHHQQQQQSPLFLAGRNTVSPHNNNNNNVKQMGGARGRPPPVKNGFKEIWSPAKQEVAGTIIAQKKYNFSRIADNLSPKKGNGPSHLDRNLEIAPSDAKCFNFENLISKSEIIVKAENTMLAPNDKYKPSVSMELTVSTNTVTATSTAPKAPATRFLRPSSLPLKPGTFTPKQHHGITPTANTLPLISPETPRPSKSCVQLYLNGHAYTYLGLKCSTKTFYCTVNKPQPVYVPNQHKLSMYSNWQVYSENNPHPLGLKPDVVMALYDSRQRPLKYATAGAKGDQCLTVNSQSIMSTVQEMPTFGGSTGNVLLNSSSNAPFSASVVMPAHAQGPNVCMTVATDGKLDLNSSATTTPISGGFENNDEYIYVRGRGRGKYVCKECGIRCKKPSMLKKHIRTHTDVRPYTCQHCSFSFKTKGNLTKHMKSKAHYKKCMELGINPVMPMDEDSIDMDNDMQSMSSERNSTIPGDEDTDTDDESDGDGDESEGSDTDESKSRLLDHEAAKCLLSLSMTPPSKTPTISNAPQAPSTVPATIFPANDDRPEPPNRSLLAVKSISEMSEQRRIVTFVSPKTGFDFLKTTGQYYSDPKACSLSKTNQSRSIIGGKLTPQITDNCEESLAMPMDLTKRKETVASKLTERNLQIHQKQQQQQQQQMMQQQQLRQPQYAAVKLKSISDVLGPLTGPASLLTSLNSINDKLPTTPTNEHNLLIVDENMQEYLTERALQDTKMKQSQMHLHKVMLEHHHHLSQPPPQNDNNLSFNRGVYTTDSRNSPNLMQIANREPSQERKSVPTIDETITDGNSSDASRMEMLADIAASSIKLHVKVPEPSPPASTPLPGDATKKPLNATNNNGGSNDNAKIVASEYLKMAKSANKMQQTVSVAPPTASGTSTTGLKKEQENNNELPQTRDAGSSAVGDEPDGGAAPKEKLPADLTGIVARTVVVGEDSFNASSTNFGTHRRLQHQEDGRPVCVVCAKTFQKTSQLRIHINIHYMERKFRCEPCGVSFRTQGHLLKHERSVSHHNKVSMTSTFGVATQSNPRPFKCKDCKIAFRIHGHLAKHLRSKLHVLKLECLGKLPFGTYAEIERAGINLTEINTTDCDNSLASLQQLAQELHEKDPSKLGAVNPDAIISLSSALLDEGRDSDSESVGSPAVADEEQQQQPPLNDTAFMKSTAMAPSTMTTVSTAMASGTDCMPLFANTAPPDNHQGMKRKLEYINLEAKLTDTSFISSSNNNNDLNGRIQDKRLKSSKNDT